MACIAYVDMCTATMATCLYFYPLSFFMYRILPYQLILNFTHRTCCLAFIRAVIIVELIPSFSFNVLFNVFRAQEKFYFLQDICLTLSIKYNLFFIYNIPSEFIYTSLPSLISCHLVLDITSIQIPSTLIDFKTSSSRHHV